MNLICERSVNGRHCQILPPSDVPYVMPECTRTLPLRLPEVSENDISRHYTELAKATHGVNDGCYPLGSCTMKYNPKINDEIAGLPGFTGIHPLQPEDVYKRQGYHRSTIHPRESRLSKKSMISAGSVMV